MTAPLFNSRCGICGSVKLSKTYNPLPSGYAQASVLICRRCDLTPDPPVQAPWQR